MTRTRRALLRDFTAAGLAAAVFSAPRRLLAADESLPPVRMITRGPKHHWFGYYDKLEFDPTNRFVLSNEVDFEHRSPAADDVIRVGMVDTADGDKWIELGESRAWNWQQGCMLQWIPGTASEVIWNDRQGDRFVSHILDVKSGKKRTLPHAVYALSPDGRWAIATDFRRLNDTRPGYGYTGLPDPNSEVTAPDDVGIWRIDLKTGEAKLLLSLADLTAVEQPGGFSPGAKHWFNHLLVAPDGRRFTFLHRWRGEAEGKSWKTRMLTADADGKNLHLLIPSGRVSHFVWRDPTHILAYAGYGPGAKEWRCQLFEDRTGKSELLEGMLPRDGHCTYLPAHDNQWILNDTYPDKQRNQFVHLHHLPTNRIIPLGYFHLPNEYRGEWRCDTHPRASNDGLTGAIDSPHTGAGRQVHLIDLRRIVNA
jgi:hypothetical protein